MWDTLLLDSNIPSTGEKMTMKGPLLVKRKLEEIFLLILNHVPGNPTQCIHTSHRG